MKITLEIFLVEIQIQLIVFSTGITNDRKPSNWLELSDFTILHKFQLNFTLEFICINCSVSDLIFLFFIYHSELSDRV